MPVFVKTESRLKKPTLTYSIGKISIDGNPPRSGRLHALHHDRGYVVFLAILVSIDLAL